MISKKISFLILCLVTFSTLYTAQPLKDFTPSQKIIDFITATTKSFVPSKKYVQSGTPYQPGLSNDKNRQVQQEPNGKIIIIDTATKSLIFETDVPIGADLKAPHLALNNDGSRLLIAKFLIKNLGDNEESHVTHFEIIEVATHAVIKRFEYECAIEACIFNPEKSDQIVLSGEGFRTRGERGLVDCPVATLIDTKTGNAIAQHFFY